jgi:polyhydroxybutyrate depolymerase
LISYRLGVLMVAALLAFALTGVGGVAPRTTPPRVDAAQACTAKPGTTMRLSVGPRTAIVHLPARQHGPMPLILVLHGAGGNGPFMERYSGFSQLADRAGFGVVYPDAGRFEWKLSADVGNPDVAFLGTLLDRVLSGGCFDAQHVSAVGVSNGGGMAALFACTGGDRLAGLVTVAGSYKMLPSCQVKRPLSVLEIHGTADQVVPYEGKPDDPGDDVLNWVRGWVRRDVCPSAARRTHPHPRVLRLDWGPCSGGTAVAHLRLNGGMHQWPGADPPDPGPELGVSATGVAWTFLHGQHLAAPFPQHQQR